MCTRASIPLLFTNYRVVLGLGGWIRVEKVLSWGRVRVRELKINDYIPKRNI
jgi:hypothetical protein